MGSFLWLARGLRVSYLLRVFCLTSVLSGAAESSEQSIEALDEESEEVYELQEFSVVAQRFGEVGDFSLVSVQVLEAGELQRQVEATLGETLAWEPGLNASYFGPGASRPVIRGLGDYRVRMLIDNIGTLDVSDNSPDHGVPLEPLLIRRVDIHRGPDALLFGNAAIGGAINSQTRYLPDSLPPAPVSGSVEGRYESAADSYSIAGYGTARAGDIALRVTGAQRSADDYDISSRARTASYERYALAGVDYPQVFNPQTAAPERVPNPPRTVSNTDIETETYSVGMLWAPHDGVGSLGISHSRYGADYGVPYQYEGYTALYGDTKLEMWQSRFDLDGSIETKTGPLERIRFRLGHADYGHEEVFTGRAWNAGRDFVDTIMGLDSTEARVDLYHRFFDRMEGVVGVHGFERELSVSGLRGASIDTAIRVPFYFETRNTGAFLVETFSWGAWTLRGGYRYERQRIMDLSNRIRFGRAIREAKEESHSLAVGLTWRDTEKWIFDEVAVSLNISRVERLPSETERYANWSNPAIQRFVVGADNSPLTTLGVEKSDAVEFGFEGHLGDWSGRFNIYSYQFDDFVFLQDESIVFSRYVAKDADFFGGEAELSWLAYKSGEGGLRFKWMADFVNGENQTDDTFLPRIPPVRVGSRVEYTRGDFKVGADLRYAFEQENVQAPTGSGVIEFETDEYFELNLDAQQTWAVRQADLTVFVLLENALNVERRSHTSFLKEIAPLPGRSLSLGARWVF